MGGMDIRWQEVHNSRDARFFALFSFSCARPGKQRFL